MTVSKMSSPHSGMAMAQWRKLDLLLSRAQTGDDVMIDGRSLDISAVVAVARHGTPTKIDENNLQNLQESVKTLQAELDKGKVIYGVNTGFGGSADTRTKNLTGLQQAISWELHSGILPTTRVDTRRQDGTHDHSLSNRHHGDILMDSVDAGLCIPSSWVRASIITRINSLASGYSAVSPEVLESLKGLLEHDIVPRIPLRGSISASGDLMPLSYIGGAIQGDPGVEVWARRGKTGNWRITTANVALKESSMVPLKYKPKEGLAVVNGTAVSTGVAALAIHDAHCLAVTSQVLTAMSVEALRGSRDSFDPIFAKLRPHPGQIESASNIHAFLGGSSLIRGNSKKAQAPGSLCQDRYSIRTAAQWIGPVLEDLLLANQQIEIECNSVTDNPVIDIEREHRSFSGGNFQARVVTSAMEKARSGLQTLGQVHFVQCTELINPHLNFGLPPNLSADEPSESFLMKPLDIAIAAFQSELGFLSNSAGSHVQCAEMGNQALNSLALISARYTHTALDVLCQLVSAHALAVCQALDLRAMQVKFLQTFEIELKKDIEDTLKDVLGFDHELSTLQSVLWDEFSKALDQTTTMDTSDRFTHIFRSLQPYVLDVARANPETVNQVREWSSRCASKAVKAYETSCDEYSSNPDARPLLGAASLRMYSYIRFELGVPFLRKSNLNNLDSIGPHHAQPLQETTSKETNTAGFQTDVAGSHDTVHIIQSEFDGATIPNTQITSEEKVSAETIADQGSDSSGITVRAPQLEDSGDEDSAKFPSIGAYLSIIYEAFRSGELYGPVFQCLEDAQKA